MIFSFLRKKFNGSFQAFALLNRFIKSLIAHFNIKKIRLSSKLCRRMSIWIGNKLEAIQRRKPPVHRRVRGQTGFHRMYIRSQILKTFFHRIKSGKCAKKRKVRRPDMSRDQYSIRTDFQHDFQKIMAVKAQDRSAVRMDISYGFQLFRKLFCILKTRQKNYIMYFSDFSVLFINRTDLTGKYKSGSLSFILSALFQNRILF